MASDAGGSEAGPGRHRAGAEATENNRSALDRPVDISWVSKRLTRFGTGGESRSNPAS